MPRGSKSAGLYRRAADGTLHPIETIEEENGDEVEVFHARRHLLPTNPWGFAMRFAETFGFKALVTVISLAMLGGTIFLVWKLVLWNRADVVTFQQTVERNTKAVESVAEATKDMAAAQHEQTQAVKDMDDRLLQHLEQDDKKRANK